MYFDDFQSRLKKGPLANLVLLFGEAEGVISEGVQAYKKAFDLANPQAEYQIFEGGVHSIGDVLNAAQTVSLFSQSQLLTVKRAEKFLGGRSDDAVERLKDYAANLNGSSYLIFLAEGLRKNAKAVNAFERSGWAVQCSEIPDWKIPAMVKVEAQTLGLALPEDASQLLVQKIGPDLAYLKRALEQLALMIHPRKSATTEDVKELPAPGVEAEVFPFLDAVGSRQGEKALRMLSQMPGGPDPGTLALLYGRVRELLGMCMGRAKGLDQGALSSQMGLNPYRVKVLWDQSGKYKASELKEALRDLIHLQAGMVTGRLGKDAVSVALETWLLKWTAPSKAGVYRK